MTTNTPRFGDLYPVVLVGLLLTVALAWSQPILAAQVVLTDFEWAQGPCVRVPSNTLCDPPSATAASPPYTTVTTDAEGITSVAAEVRDPMCGHSFVIGSLDHAASASTFEWITRGKHAFGSSGRVNGVAKFTYTVVPSDDDAEMSPRTGMILNPLNKRLTEVISRFIDCGWRCSATELKALVKCSEDLTQ